VRVLDLFKGYRIREDGMVTSRFGRTLKTQPGNSGYLRVELSGKKYLLHRLLATAFIPNPDAKPQVNHKDGNKTNNRLDNLEWVTRSENQEHAYAAGLQRGFKKPTPLSSSHRKALCGSRWKTETHFYHCDGKTFSNLYLAAEFFGVSRQTVLNRCRSSKFPTWSKEVIRHAA